MTTAHLTTIPTAGLAGYRGNDFAAADVTHIAECSGDLTPIVAVDGWMVADGRHRTLAALKAGISTILAYVIDETEFMEILDEADGDLEIAAVVVEARAAGVV